MGEIKSVIEFLEKVRKTNVKIFDSCSEEKLLRDTDYNNLYQAFWQVDFRLKNVISLLKFIEESSMHKQTEYNEQFSKKHVVHHILDFTL